MVLTNRYSLSTRFVRTISRCDHQNVTKLFQFYEMPTSYVLILEFVNGGDLFDAIRESTRFTEVDAVRIIKGRWLTSSYCKCIRG